MVGSAAQTKRMSHSHPTKRTLVGRGRGIEIEVAVDVHEMGLTLIADNRGAEPEGDSATAADDEEAFTRHQEGSSGIGKPTESIDFLVEVLCHRPITVRFPAVDRQITHIVDPMSGGLHRTDQARVAEGGRCLLDTHTVGRRAAGVAEDVDRRHVDHTATQASAAARQRQGRALLAAGEWNALGMTSDAAETFHVHAAWTSDEPIRGETLAAIGSGLQPDDETSCFWLD